MKRCTQGECPPIVVEQHEVAGKHVRIVRDDLLPGGTKQRGAVKLLQHLKEAGHDRFVYASPFCGYAQIALSYACSLTRTKCVIFAVASPGTMDPAPYTKRAADLGAEIVLVKDLNEAEAHASAFAQESGAKKIPLGFDCDVFNQYYREAVGAEWRRLSETLREPPKNLWLPVGSGTLARVFETVVERGTKLKLVNVRVLSPDDPRLRSLSNQHNDTFYSCSQEFQEPDPIALPVPSNRFYDAKVASMLSLHGDDGDVWWNVAS